MLRNYSRLLVSLQWWRAHLAFVLVSVLSLAHPSALALPLSSAELATSPWRGKIESQLLQLYDIWGPGNEQAARQFAQLHALALGTGGLVRLEMHAPAPIAAVPAPWLSAAGGRLIVAGWDRADIEVPLARLAELAQRPEVTRLQFPTAPIQLEVQSKGVALGGLQPYHCQNLRGQGMSIAVVDVGFAGWSAAVQAGELPKGLSAPIGNGITHGTDCAEVIYDLAPAAKIVPVLVESVASLQAWVQGPMAAQMPMIISHSLVWHGLNFGDGTGPLCKAVEAVRAKGGVWVTGAGNDAAGTVWRGVWRDDNGDGWLEFADGDTGNRFPAAQGVQVLGVLDWDSYPATNIDLDLSLCRVEGAKCVAVAESTSPQMGSQPPYEVVSMVVPAAAKFAWRIRKFPGPTPKEIRLKVHFSEYTSLQFFTKAKTLGHPADCQAAIAVAALPVTSYATGPVAAYSSRGPTSDGRAKPDLGAPTGVATSQGDDFAGTSAACPHVAAAIAIQAQASGTSPSDAAAAVVAAALPLPGSPVPDYEAGKGRLFLGLAGSGAACQPDAKTPCPTVCGSSGSRACSGTCALSACVPPSESCNGKDDDCDGQTDESFSCTGKAVLPCDTSCGTKGTRSCDAKCSWTLCKAPAELCNGQDDDCDGQSDEDFACARDGIEPCITADGREGIAQCSSSCAKTACVANEVCNGEDDDGDGQVDEELGCPPIESAWCQASRVASARNWGDLALMLMALGLLVQSRRRPAVRRTIHRSAG